MLKLNLDLLARRLDASDRNCPREVVGWRPAEVAALLRAVATGVVPSDAPPLVRDLCLGAAEASAPTAADARLRDTVVGWVNNRIAAMIARPPMYGSAEAVELQVLVLVEVLALVLQPDRTLKEPHRVLDAYNAHLRQRFPKRGLHPLHELVTGDNVVHAKLAAELQLAVDALRVRLQGTDGGEQLVE